MNPTTRLPVRLAAVLAVVGLAGTGGAVAAAELVTGATIKDGSVTGADLADGTLRSGNVHDGSLTGADVRDHDLTLPDLSDPARDRLRGVPGIRGFVVAHQGRLVAPNVNASVSVTCPDGKIALSAQGFLSNGTDFSGTLGVQTTLSPDSGTVFARNTTGSTQSLEIDVLCGAVDRRTL